MKPWTWPRQRRWYHQLSFHWSVLANLCLLVVVLVALIVRTPG